jgi:hypothetical protein
MDGGKFLCGACACVRPHMMCALCGGVWAADVADMNRGIHCDARLSHVVSVGVAAHLRLGRRKRGAIVFGCEEGAHQPVS